MGLYPALVWVAPAGFRLGLLRPSVEPSSLSASLAIQASAPKIDRRSPEMDGDDVRSPNNIHLSIAFGVWDARVRDVGQMRQVLQIAAFETSIPVLGFGNIKFQYTDLTHSFAPAGLSGGAKLTPAEKENMGARLPCSADSSGTPCSHHRFDGETRSGVLAFLLAPETPKHRSSRCLNAHSCRPT